MTMFAAFALWSPLWSSALYASEPGQPGAVATPMYYALQIQLTAGWNLISPNGSLIDPSISSVFGSTPQVVQAYTWMYDRWVIAKRESSGNWSGDLTEMVDGRGYWVNSTDAVTLVLRTYAPVSVSGVLSYSYPAGWNAIGFVSQQSTKPVSSYLSNIDGKWTIIHSFDQINGWQSSSPSGVGFQNMEIGRGYWLYLSEPGTIIP